MEQQEHQRPQAVGPPGAAAVGNPASSPRNQESQPPASGPQPATQVQAGQEANRASPAPGGQPAGLQHGDGTDRGPDRGQGVESSAASKSQPSVTAREAAQQNVDPTRQSSDPEAGPPQQAPAMPTYVKDSTAPDNDSSKPRLVVPLPSNATGAKPRGIKKCVECGSTDTPMWRTHPVHGRGTLCNACGVKLYRKQCKHRNLREKQLAEAAGWANGSAEELLANGLLAAEDWSNPKRQKLSAGGQLARSKGMMGGLPASQLLATADLHGAASNPALLPVLTKALAAASGGPGPYGMAESVPLAHQQARQPDPHIPGCQFAFRGQLPDGSIEPRAIHDVTVALETPREPGTVITQSHLAVLDSSGGKLATYHTAEVEPRLEYDEYLNAAVWDSRDGWWLLLPTPEHAMAFQGMMRVLAARKLGLMYPPQLPQADVAQQMAPVAPVGARGQTYPVPPSTLAAMGQGPPQQAPGLQHLAQQLPREQGARRQPQQGPAQQAAGAGETPEQLVARITQGSVPPADYQQVVALVAQGLVAMGVMPGAGDRAGSPSDKPSYGLAGQQQPEAVQQQQRPPSTTGAGPAPAEQFRGGERMHMAPPQRVAGDAPSAAEPAEGGKNSSIEHLRMPGPPGPAPFAAPSPGASLGQRFGGGIVSSPRGGPRPDQVAKPAAHQQPGLARGPVQQGDSLGEGASGGTRLPQGQQRDAYGAGGPPGRLAPAAPPGPPRNNGTERQGDASAAGLGSGADAAFRLLAALQQQQQQQQQQQRR